MSDQTLLMPTPAAAPRSVRRGLGTPHSKRGIYIAIHHTHSTGRLSWPVNHPVFNRPTLFEPGPFMDTPREAVRPTLVTGTEGAALTSDRLVSTQTAKLGIILFVVGALIAIASAAMSLGAARHVGAITSIIGLYLLISAPQRGQRGG